MCVFRLEPALFLSRVVKGTILHRHSRKGNIDMVKLLLNFGTDIEAKDQVSLQRETLTRPLAKLCMHVRVGCIAREDAHVSVCCSMLVPVRVLRAGCPALEGVTACLGRSCRCVAAADCTPALLDHQEKVLCFNMHVTDANTHVPAPSVHVTAPNMRLPMST
jgi:hypothetical protein